jgi:hypothetical protein
MQIDLKKRNTAVYGVLFMPSHNWLITIYTIYHNHMKCNMYEDKQLSLRITHFSLFHHL